MTVAEDSDVRMSLGEHLGELRSRLFRVVIAVFVLGGLSLAFARPIFALLMRPVLNALPADGRSLIYTSGIEEVNVLMKVGLYAGIFLSTPVILWQIWQFVAPGLYETERKFAAPFVFFGSIAFIIGAAFCYFILLPTMFEFLLQEGSGTALEKPIATAQRQEAEALRWLRLGEPARAGKLAQAAQIVLANTESPGNSWDPSTRPDPWIEMGSRVDGFGRLLDATEVGFSSQRAVLRNVMEKRLVALEAFAQKQYEVAGVRLDEAASQLASASQQHATDFAALWKLEKTLSEKGALLHAQAWTRPMLTMNEQLSLVLLLELAFGVIFELPLVMALLAVVGLVRTGFLVKYQRHAIVVCLIAAAIITPTGDAINLALMAGPMILCYEIGVIAVWLIDRRRRRREAEEGLEPA